MTRISIVNAIVLSTVACGAFLLMTDVWTGGTRTAEAKVTRDIPTGVNAVVWQRQAFGQVMNFPCSSGTFNWPDNNNWSQSEVIVNDTGCNPPLPYVAQPSNWTTPTAPNGAGTNVILTAATAPTNVNVQATLNSLTVQSGAGGLSMSASSFLDVQNYDFQTDGTFLNSGGGGSAPYIRIAGTFKKSSGAGTLDTTGGSSQIYLRLAGGTVQVDSGTLKLGRSVDASSGGTFIVAAGAAIDFNSQDPGAAGNYFGTYAGTGAGEFRLNGGYINVVGPGAMFNFAGNLFQWGGATLGAGPGLTNTGTINMVGSANKQIDGQSFHNAGLMIHSGTGNLQFGINSLMFNDAGATYDIRSDVGVNPGGRIENLGTFKKSGGSGISNIGAPPAQETYFNHLGGTVEVTSGTLRLARGDNTGGAFVVGPGATLDLNGGSVSGSYSGTYTGTGGGTVQINSGNININGPGATFDLDGVDFQWNGGSISAGATFNNTGTIRMGGSGGWGIGGVGFTNSGTMIHEGSGALQWGANASMTNAASGVYDIRSDGLVTNRGQILNHGTFRKSAGNGVSTIGEPSAESSFRILGGTVEVTSGTLRLGRSYPESTGGSFIVGAGAVLDLTGSSGSACEYIGNYSGTGAGRLELNGGQITIQAPGGSFDFAGDLFQWSGGSIYHNSPDPFANNGTINIAGNVQFGGFGMTNNGSIKGSGKIEYTGTPSFLTNNGTIAPGANSPGRLDIAVPNGDITLAATSTLAFRIGGNVQGSTYSWLNKIDSRALILGGNLMVTLENGVTPLPGEIYTIITTQNTISGTFANVANNTRITTTDGMGSFKVNNTGTAITLSEFKTPTPVRADFDGDGRTDVSVYRPSLGDWYLNRSSAGIAGLHFGAQGDVPVPADYDHDGKTDVAVFRGSTGAEDADFFVFNSSNGTFSYGVWGLPGDVPISGDFDGDGRADYAIWRPSDLTWYLLKSTGGAAQSTFGMSGDLPMAIDFDGDGKANLTLFRPSEGRWYIARPNGEPSENFDVVDFGLAGDQPVPADYDGDGKDDIAVFRPSDGGGVWYIRRSTNGSVDIAQFGLSSDVPVPGDYDGDGNYDIGAFRGGTWYLNRSTAGFTGVDFGLGSDIPVPKSYLP